MPRNDVVGEMADAIHITANREELKGADADMARRHAGQYRAGQRRFTPDRLAGRDNGEGSGRRDAERRHRLADDVFAQDRPERGTAVAIPGKRRGTGALELDVAADAVGVDKLAQKNCASVTELRHEMPELVAGISHGEWLASLGHRLPARIATPSGVASCTGIEPEMPGERFVQPHQTGRSDRGGRKPRKKSVGQTRVAVIEGKNVSCFGWCEHFISGA